MDMPLKLSRRVDFDLLFYKLRFADRAEISAARFAEAFDYELNDLQRLAHVDQAHAVNLRQSPQLQSFMEATLKVMSSASLLLADADEAVTWFKTYHLAEFDGKTPEQMVSAKQHRELLKHLSNAAQEPIPQSNTFSAHP